MKTIYIAFLTIFILSLNTASAQFKTNSPSSHAQYEAGKLLKNFSRQYYIGYGFVAVGYAVAIVGAYNNNDGAVTAGGLLVLGGLVATLASFAKIGRAGEQLMLQSQYVGYNGARVNSLGWRIPLSGRRHKRSSFLSMN